MPSFDTNVGIHTHADGVIHIHPHSQLGVGANATLGRYMKNARDEGDLEFSLSSTKIEYLGETFEEGETECDGVDDPQVRMAYWSNVQDESVEPEVTSGGFEDIRLRSEEHTSELQSLMRRSYAVFCVHKKTGENSNTQQE